MYVITGQPGTGKSAVIGWLARLAAPDQRARLVEAGMLGPDDPAPAQGAFDAVIHVQGKTAADLLGELTAAAQTPGVASANELAGRLGEHGTGLTVLVDALDKAAACQAMACAGAARTQRSARLSGDRGHATRPRGRRHARLRSAAWLAGTRCRADTGRGG